MFSFRQYRNLYLVLILMACIFHPSAGQLAKQNINKKSGFHSETYQSMTFDGAWCWFSDPRAVYYEGKHKRTYTGWVDSYGDIHAACYDHETGLIQSKVIANQFEVDDHDNPSILIDENGRIMCFFSKHAQNDPICFLKSVHPENITEWENPKILALNDTSFYKGMRNSYTYCSPIKLSGENGRIYLFWRGVDGKPTYSFSEDNGENWTSGRIFIMPEKLYPFSRPYVKIYSSGNNKIHFAFTDGHPRDEKDNSIYYMYYLRGSFYKANNEKICDTEHLPVKPQHAGMVYDAKISGQKSWIWDIAEDEKGNAVIAYVKFNGDSNHIYCYARWDGQKWNHSELINSGGWFPETPVGEREAEPNYSGGISIDHENTNTIYLSVKRDSVFEIEKWTTPNNGKSWNVEYITKGSSKNNVRPFAVRGAKDGNPLQVLWMQNTRYVHYGLNAYKGKITFNHRYHASIKMNIIAPTTQNPLQPEEIKNLMRKVADWQLANPHKSDRRDWL